MWQFLIDHIPGWLTVFCTILVVAIPLIISKINQMLGDYGNPSWKTEDERKKSEN